MNLIEKKEYMIIKNEITKKELNKQLYNYNFGFALLKNILAFDVIITHCFYKNKTQNNIIRFITKRRKVHVPSFFIPTMIFMFSNLNNTYKKFQRLSSFNILIFQLLTGQGQKLFHFWYLFDLIFTTLLFMEIIILFRKKHLFIINLLLIFSYFIQYSEYHRKIVPYFHGIQGLSREIELLPFVVVGFTLNALNILKILENYKLNSFIMCLLIYNLANDYNIFIKIFGISYHGIKLNILSICLVILFSLFPSNKIKNKKLINRLKFITNYSGGIFYLHQVVHFFFKTYYKDIRDGTFNGVIQIYFISYIICMIGANVFSKTQLKFLFI